MIIGIGTDLVDISRIEQAVRRHGERFEDKCFTAYERARGNAMNEDRRMAFYAKRFAAKEACAKAMGTGFTGAFSLRDIGVEEDAAGRPFLVLAETAQTALKALIPQGYSPRLHLSLSDEKHYAHAYVILEAVI